MDTHLRVIGDPMNEVQRVTTKLLGLKYTKIEFCGVVLFLIPMRCIINCDNIKVEVFIYVYYW